MNYTFLYDEHIKLKAKMAEYASFMMPIEYGGIEQEHQAVRNSCGIFDVSHMGEILLTGKDALAYANYLISNKITVNDQQKVLYGILLNDEGYPLDDLFVYPLDYENILLVVNAANITNDINWLKNWRRPFDVKIKNQSANYSEVALQGPQAHLIFEQYFKVATADFKFMTFKYVNYLADKLLVSRSGYTGEDGFEIYGAKESIKQIFIDLVEKYGVTPCGLGARDTLRFEAALPLYGHEMSESINPLEAGMSFGVKFDKPDFKGKTKLLAMKEKGLSKKLVGLELIERNIARANYQVFKNDKKVGYITTGYKSISLNRALALALIDINEANIDNEVEIQIRTKRVKAKVVPLPFYKKNYVR